MPEHPRILIGQSLSGRIVEVGPGVDPFPTAPGSTVVFADKSVPGGRDATWPELAGHPHGPDADIDVDLDIDGLKGVDDGAFDVVIASHVIEHLANPLAALVEFARVLRLGGRLVLVVPDRTTTFDAPRLPTPYAHVRDEFDRGVTIVDDDHIREFCAAVFSQPSIHPSPVREWHDPANLGEELLDLHRRRSIHVHCWNPEEFTSLLVAAVSDGLTSWRLLDMYVLEDFGDTPAIEFALALERLDDAEPAADVARRLARDWVAAVQANPVRDQRRIASFDAALRRDLGSAAPPVMPRQRFWQRLRGDRGVV
jgi:SAM-dependent methyltransferase